MLNIQDLSKEIDMTVVRGGDNANAVSNAIGQVQNISVPVNVASTGPTNTFVHVSGSQSAAISNHLTAGDKFSAFLGVIRGSL